MIDHNHKYKEILFRTGQSRLDEVSHVLLCRYTARLVLPQAGGYHIFKIKTIL
ncbi:MAG: hypothetical protein JXN62_03205 [Bacteroidales bacterium]|nr:hypothetical protein [Bacteroidales bacterium]